MALLHRPDAPDIAFDTTGEGPDLLLVHGITESSATWAPLVPALAGDHRVITVDLRGHGDSAPADGYDLADMAADVQAVLDHVEAEDPLVVGHSLGGFVVSVLASANPVRAVVNVDQPLALAAFKAALSEVEPMLRSDAFGQVITMMFAEYAAPLAELERTRLEQLRAPSQQAVLGIWDPVFTMSEAELDAMVRDRVGDIEAPYLALHGTDPGPDYRAWLADVVPQARLEVVEGSGHYPHLFAPDAFVARLSAFERTLA